MPFPALLESVPYRKDDWLIPGHAPMHAEFAARGYASVLLDVRGTGRPEGIAEDEYTEAEITRQPGRPGLAARAAVVRRLAGHVRHQLGRFRSAPGGDAPAARAEGHHPGRCHPRSLRARRALHRRHAARQRVGHLAGRDGGRERAAAGSRSASDRAGATSGCDGSRRRRNGRGPGSGISAATTTGATARPSWTTTPSRRPVLAMNGFNDGYRDAVLELLEHLHVPRRGVLGPWGHSWPHAGWPEPSIDGLGLDGPLVGPLAEGHRQRGRPRADAGRLPGRADASGRVPRADAGALVVHRCLAAGACRRQAEPADPGSDGARLGGSGLTGSSRLPGRRGPGHAGSISSVRSRAELPMMAVAAMHLGRAAMGRGDGTILGRQRPAGGLADRPASRRGGRRCAGRRRR